MKGEPFMNCYTQMLIGEAITGEYVTQLVNRMQDHVRSIPELIGHSILAEEGGRMVVLVTDWPCRQDCLQYHSSRAYVSSTWTPSICWPVVTLSNSSRTKPKGGLYESRNPRKASVRNLE
jgi:hypothetical protein